MAMLERNLKVDQKKRITLGKLAAEEVSSYDVEVKDNGVIVLYPKVEIPADELWLFKNKKALNAVKEGLRQSAEGKVSSLGKNFWDGIEE